MSKPIYKMFIGKVTEAWHQLPKAEQDALMAKVNAALEKVGGKRLIMCNSAWSTEQYHFWGVEEFPNIEAVQNHTHLLGQLDWGRYVESQSWLGTEFETL